MGDTADYMLLIARLVTDTIATHPVDKVLLRSGSHAIILSLGHGNRTLGVTWKLRDLQDECDIEAITAQIVVLAKGVQP